MNQYKDIRAFRQEHGEEITLQNVAIHGNADINEELPESFTISLTPPSMLRLKKVGMPSMMGLIFQTPGL